MAIRTKYAKIPIAAIGGMTGENSADFAVFLSSPTSNAPVLYRRAGGDISEPDYGRLREHGVTHILVKSDDLCKCEMVVESRLAAILAHDAFTPPEKAKLVHQIGASIARDITQDEKPAANTTRACQLIDNVITCVLNDPQVAEHMLTMAGHERTVASHMFMVSSLAVMLAAEVYGPDVDFLKAVGVAGMLHDLGKLTIPQEILNKPGSLTPEELQVIEHHPIESVRLVNDDPNVSPLMRQMILQHHERVDGKGYPVGICGADLLPGSRIISIVDSFHAMIGRRSYRAAMTPIDANRVMNAFSGTQFDADLLKAWNDLFARGWSPDAAADADGAGPTVEEVSSRHEHRSNSPARDVQLQRKRRHKVRTNITVKCVYAGRLRDVSQSPDAFLASVHDISRGGMCLCTHHPMYRGEIIHMQINDGDRAAWVRAVVSWCRQQTGTIYRTGVRFVERISEEVALQRIPLFSAGTPSSHELADERDAIMVEKPAVPRKAVAAAEIKEADALKTLADIAAMREVPLDSERTVIALASARSDRVRLKTVAVLAKINSRASKAVLMSMLDDESPDLKEAVIGVIGRMKLTDALPKLQDLVNGTSPAIALRAAAALAHMGDHRGMPLVKRYLWQDGPDARLAALALGEIAGSRFAANEHGIAAARRYLDDPPKDFGHRANPKWVPLRTAPKQKPTGISAAPANRR